MKGFDTMKKKIYLHELEAKERMLHDKTYFRDIEKLTEIGKDFAVFSAETPKSWAEANGFKHVTLEVTELPNEYHIYVKEADQLLKVKKELKDNWKEKLEQKLEGFMEAELNGSFNEIEHVYYARTKDNLVRMTAKTNHNDYASLFADLNTGNINMKMKD